MYEGRDGYSMFKADPKCLPLHDEDNYVDLLLCLRQFLRHTEKTWCEDKIKELKTIEKRAKRLVLTRSDRVVDFEMTYDYSPDNKFI